MQVLIAVDLDMMNVGQRNKVMVETDGSPRFRAIGYVSQIMQHHRPYERVLELDLKLVLNANDYYDARRAATPVEDQAPVQATAQVIQPKQLENKK